MSKAVGRLITSGIKQLKKDAVKKWLRSAARYGSKKVTNIVLKWHIKSSGWIVLDSYELLSHCNRDRTWFLEEDISNLSPKVAKEVVPLKDNPKLSYNNRIWHFKPPFVTEVNNVTILGTPAIAFANNGKIIADTMHWDPYGEFSSSRLHYNSNRLLINNVRDTILESPVEVGKALVGYRREQINYDFSYAAILRGRKLTNYYAWIVRALLRLRGIARYERETGEDVRLIIPPDPPNFVLETLEMLGYGQQYVEWENDPKWVENLVVSSHPEPTPKALRWLRHQMQNATPDSQGSPQWIYISRQDADRGRIVKNYSEVKEVLEKHGIEPIMCEKMSVTEQVNIFSNAQGVIAPHGAGLTNIIWGENLSIIELFNEVVNSPYYTLAHILDHDYVALAQEPTGTAEHDRHLDIIVDVEEFEKAIEQMKGNSN